MNPKRRGLACSLVQVRVPLVVVPADDVGREAAALGVLADGLGVVGLVHAVDLVARHVAVVPGVGHAEPAAAT